MAVQQLLPMILLMATFVSTKGFPVKENVELVYEFRGQVTTGIVKEMKQCSGFILKGKVRIQNQQGVIYIQFFDLLFGKTNGPLSGNKQAVDELDFTFNKENQVTTEFLEHLEIPFRATFENGLVKSFDTETQDCFWSVNFKRAFLSLIQLNLKKYSKDKAHTYFMIEEDSIQGICDTSYEVIPRHSRIVITKLRHLDSCKNKPFHFFSNMIEAQCSEEKRDFLRKFSHVTYIVNTDVQNIIDKIVGTNFLEVTPFGNMGQSVLSKVIQQMTLLDLRTVENRLELNAEFTTYDTLRYTFSEEDDEGNSFDRLISAKYRDYFHRAEKNFEDLSEVLSNGNEVSSDDYNRLLRLFLPFTYEEFVKFSERHFGRSLGKASEEIVANCLPMVGTSASVVFSLKWIKEQFYLSKSNWLIQQILTKLPFYVRKPSKIMIKEFYKFLKNTEWKGSPLEDDGWLSFGTLLHQSCNYKNPVSGTTFIDKEDCSKFIKILSQKFHQTTHPERKMELLKALFNTRSSESFKVMLAIIKSNGYGNSFKKLALQSALTIQLPFNELFQLIEASSQIVRNSSIDWSLKVSAYQSLLHFALDEEHMAAILTSALNEPNKNIGVTVYRMAMGLHNSTSPCFNHLKEYLKKILPTLVPPIENTGVFSGNRIFSAYNVQYDYGRSDQISWIAKNGFTIPHQFLYMKSIYLTGRRFNVIELDFLTEENLFDSDFIKLMLFHFFSLRNLKIPFMKNDFASTKIQIHMKTFDQFILSSEGLKSFLLKGYFPKTFTVNTFELNYDLPNDLGFLISLQSKMDSLHIVSLEGLENQDKIDTDGHFDIQYRDEVSLKARMSVMTPMGLSFGFGIKTKQFNQFPLEGAIDSFKNHLDTTGIDLSLDISQKKTKLFHYESIPFTFIDTIDKKEIIPLNSQNTVQQNSFHFGQDYLGIRFNIQTKLKRFGRNDDVLRSLLFSVFNKRSHSDADVHWIEDTYTLYNSLRDFSFLNPILWQTEIIITSEPNPKDSITQFKFSLKLSQKISEEASQVVAEDGFKYDLGIQEAELTINALHKNETEKKWLLQMQTSHLLPPKVLDNVHVNFMRTPLFNYDENPLIVSFDMKLNDNSRFLLNKKNLKYARVEYLSKLELLNYGDEIIFKLVFEKTEEEKKILNSESSTKVISKCEKYWKRKIFDSFCWKKAMEYLCLRRITADVQLQRNEGFNDPDYLKGIVSESFLSQYLNETLESKEYLMSRMRFEANLSFEPTSADSSFYWYSPKEQEFVLKNADVGVLQPYLLHETLQEKIFRNIFGINSQVACHVSLNTILMFNGSEFEHRFTDSYQSLCKSCSTPQLINIGVQKKGERLDFLIFTSHLKVEMLWINENYVFKINNYIENDPKTSRLRNLPSNNSIYYQDGSYWFTLEDIGFEITLDGYNIDILINNGFRGRVCGLCGTLI